MKARAPWFVLSLLTLCLFPSCGGGSSGGAGTCLDLSGSWSVTSIDDNTQCGDPVSTNTWMAVTMQNGCSYTMTSESETVTGTISGRTVTGTSISRDGMTKGNVTATISQDGTSITGTDVWTRASLTKNCTGTSQVAAYRNGAIPDAGMPVLGSGGATVLGFGGSLASGGAIGTGGQGGSGGANAGHADAAVSDAKPIGACGLVGLFPTTQANHVVTSGGYAYVANGKEGISILDVTNPAKPSLAGSLPTTNATKLAINGNILYVADGSGGLKVVDVTNPASPKLVATPTLPSIGPSELQTLALSGGYLYGGYVGLSIFDVATPSAPVGKGSLNSTFVEDLVVEGTVVYAATANGLETYSVVSPAGPFVIAHGVNSDWDHAIALSSGYAYLGGQNGLSVFDVSSPSTPSLVASSGAISSINAMTTQGTTLFVSGQGPGLTMVDVSNPKAPKVLGKCGETLVGSANNLTISGSYGYVAAGNAGVIILDLSMVLVRNTDAGSGPEVSPIDAGAIGGSPSADGGTLPPSGSPCSLVAYYPAPLANHVVTSGGRTYVAEGKYGIEIVDLTSSPPKALGALPTTNATRLAISGSDLYLADGAGGIKVIDVSNPASPQIVATPATSDHSPEIDTLLLVGNNLYAGFWSFNVFDVTNPAATVARGYLDTNFLQDLATDGTLVYAATADGLDIYSVVSPSSPFLVGTGTSADWGAAIAVSPGYAYYGGRSGLSVFDVSTPTAPSLVSSSGAVTPINALALHNKYLYVAGQGPGLSIMDVSNPTAPKVVGKCGETAVGTPTSITISGSYGYVAGGNGGVFLLSLAL